VAASATSNTAGDCSSETAFSRVTNNLFQGQKGVKVYIGFHLNRNVKSIAKSIKELDSLGMLEAAFALPNQIETALKLKVDIDDLDIDNIIIAGMGGSAIGGDIVKTCIEGLSRVPIETRRGYHLPSYVNDRTLLIPVSYSGNTRETLALTSTGLEKGAKVIGVSTGGRLGEVLDEHGRPWIRIPNAPMPRAAPGFLTVPIFNILEAGGIASFSTELGEVAEALKKIAPRYRPGMADNTPMEIAAAVAGRVPLVYAPEAYEPAAKRWMTQFNENSKTIAHWGMMPEIAHNEIVGCDGGLRGAEHIIILRGDAEGETTILIKYLEETLTRHDGGWTEVNADPVKGRLGMFHHIMVGDIASIYLALMRQMDPAEIDAIVELKKRYEQG